ncbi:uncharacterized protein TNCV_4806151 [Trichonephila clavipes]|nr:uncharacterized protein TNCV_4806151 [Trichonephila clavipes]
MVRDDSKESNWKTVVKMPSSARGTLPGKYEATQVLFLTDLIISNHVELKRPKPELAPYSPNFHTMQTLGLRGLKDLRCINPSTPLSSGTRSRTYETSGDCGSLVVKVTDSRMACHEFEPGTAEDPLYKGDRCTLMSKLKCTPVGVVWKLGEGVTVHVLSTSLDHGSKLLDPSPKALAPVNWPPRSCNLTPLDYFLWGYVKSLVYVDKPQTLDHLEDNIHRVIADIRPQMLEKVIENWMSRLDYIRVSRGSPMPEIIFKM